MSNHPMDYSSMEEEIIEAPLADGSLRSTSSYTFEEVDSVYSDYTFETLNESSNSLHNSFSSGTDIVSSVPTPPSNVVVPSDSLGDMKNFLRSNAGLDFPPKEAPKKEEKQEAPKRNSALDDMKKFLRSELGIDEMSPMASKPQDWKGAASLDLAMPSFSMNNRRKSDQFATFGDSELARSIAYLKEGVDVEVIEYVMSDEEEIIDDVFDHMGGLDGRDTVMLESFGLAAIPEISNSEYESAVDDGLHPMRTSEISILSSDFPIGDTNDGEVDMEPNKPKPTGLHEPVKKTEEKVGADSKDIDESMTAENTSPTGKSGKAAKWKDRIKKKRHKSDKEDGEMDVDNTTADDQENQQHKDKIRSKRKSSRKSKHESSKSKDSSGSSSTKKKEAADSKKKELKDANTEIKAKKGKVESGSQPNMAEPKASPKSKRGKKTSKWQDRLQKKRSKKDLNQESDSSAPDDLTDGENDLKDSSHLPIHVTNAKSERVQIEPDPSHDLTFGGIVAKVDGAKKVAANSIEADTVQGNESRPAKKEDSPKEKSLLPSDGPEVQDRIDTKVEITGDEDNDKQNVDTSRSMRIFDDEFGSVGGPSTSIERSNRSSDHSEFGSDGVVHELQQRIESENASHRSVSQVDDSIRSLRGVFDDELGETPENLRSSIYSTESSILEELDEVDKDDETASEAESLLSKGVSAESNERGQLKEVPDNASRRSRRDDSVRTLRGVFDDELGDAKSNVRSSNYSMESSILEELDEVDKDDETATTNEEGESTGAGNDIGMKSSRENNGESKNNFKFELPNELLEAIHYHHQNKNVSEKQGDRESSDILLRQNCTPAEKEKDGSATYSTLPPTVEELSRTLGDEVAENTSTPDLIDEVSQDDTHSDAVSAETADTVERDLKVQKKAKRRRKGPRGSCKSVEKESQSKTTRDDEIDSTSTPAKYAKSAPSQPVPGRLLLNQRVIDNATGKSTSFLAAYEMTSKHRRREIVLRSAELASEGNLPELASSNDMKNKYSDGLSMGDREKLIGLLKATPSMVTKAGRKKVVIESLDATVPPESWAPRISSRKDELHKQTAAIATSNQDSPLKSSARFRGADGKASSKVNNSESQKTHGQNGAESKIWTKSTAKNQKRAKSNSLYRSQREDILATLIDEKQPQIRSSSQDATEVDSLNPRNENKPKNGRSKTRSSSDRGDTHKSKSRKRSKTRSRKAPGRSRSSGTAEFLESLSEKEGLDQTSVGSDDKDTKRRNRREALKRSKSMEVSRSKKRKERRNGVGDNSERSTGDSKETRGDLSGGPKPSWRDKDQMQEIADSLSPRETGRKKQHKAANGDKEDTDVLLSPGTRRRRTSSIERLSKVEATRRRKSGSDGKSPRRSNGKTIDKIRSPSEKKKSVDLPSSPSLRKKSVDLSEGLKHDMKSPKKGRSSTKDIQSPKAEKPNLQRSKSDNGKSPRNSWRKSLDKIRSPSSKKKSTIPNLESEMMSPTKSPSSRRSYDFPSPTLTKKSGTSKRSHSVSPMEKSSSGKPQSAFMEYYDSVREVAGGFLEKSDDEMDLQIPPLPVLPSPKQRKSNLRGGQRDSAEEKSKDGESVRVGDIWGLVKLRDQLDRSIT